MRGFGIDATVPPDVAEEVAIHAERCGYSSFWVNGSPPQSALEIITRAARVTELDLGVGVFPLTRISADELVIEVHDRRLPQDRLWLGVGSSRSPGALDEVRQAIHTLRADLSVRVAQAAVGPRMTVLAGEISDAVIFTWWIRSEIERSKVLLEQGAASAGRHMPKVVSYIRCALMPQAEAAVTERAEGYDRMPRYQHVFARLGIAAADTVITAETRADLLPHIEDEEEVLDVSVIRAIPAGDTVESLAELVVACAP